MKNRIATCCALAVLVAAVAAAQSSWTAHTGAGEYAFARGDLRRAESEFRAALDIAQGFAPGDRRLETSLENLARLYEHESDFDRAQPLYLLLLAAKENRLGTDSSGLLDTLFAIARVSQPMGDLPTVEDSLARYAAIAASSETTDARKHWQVLQMLSRMQTIQERPEQALEWQRRAGRVIADDPSATTEEWSILLEALAEMELVAGNGPEAERIYLEVAAMRTSEFGAVEYPRIAARGAKAALAAAELETAERLALIALGADPDADAALEATRVLAELSWIRVNRGTDNMAALLAAAAADPELDRASERLAALVEAEADGDPTTLSRLAQVEALRGRPSAAADWQLQLIATLPADSGGAAHARRNLVTLLAAAGRWDEALAENMMVLENLEARLGPSDPRLIPVLAQRVALLEEAGRKRDAKQVRKRLKKMPRQ